MKAKVFIKNIEAMAMRAFEKLYFTVLVYADINKDKNRTVYSAGFDDLQNSPKFGRIFRFKDETKYEIGTRT